MGTFKRFTCAEQAFAEFLQRGKQGTKKIGSHNKFGSNAATGVTQQLAATGVAATGVKPKLLTEWSDRRKQ